MQIAGRLEFSDLEVPSLVEAGIHYGELYSLWVFQKGFETMEE